MHVFLREVEAELARPCFREGSFETFSEARRSVRPRQQADALHGASLIFIETELRAAFREELFGEIGDAGWDGGVDRLLGKVFDRVEIVVEGCAVASRLARDRGGGHFAIRHSRELIPKRSIMRASAPFSSESLRGRAMAASFLLALSRRRWLELEPAALGNPTFPRDSLVLFPF